MRQRWDVVRYSRNVLHTRTLPQDLHPDMNFVRPFCVGNAPVHFCRLNFAVYRVEQVLILSIPRQVGTAENYQKASPWSESNIFSFEHCQAVYLVLGLFFSLISSDSLSAVLSTALSKSEVTLRSTSERRRILSTKALCPKKEAEVPNRPFLITGVFFTFDVVAFSTVLSTESLVPLCRASWL